MRVGQPGVHRREPGLRPEADEHERERHPHQGGIECRGIRAQLGPIQRGRSLAQRAARGVVREQQPEQREAEADRTEHEVLPSCLERMSPPKERDEERSR